MSVESEWEKIAFYLNARWFACLDGSDTDAMRDRLILEVQAEMQCYSSWGGGKHWISCLSAKEECEERWYDTEKMPMCPSCTAKVKLAKVKVGA